MQESSRMFADLLALIGYLCDRLAGSRTRAKELRTLRERLVGHDLPGDVGLAEWRLAMQMRHLRLELGVRFGKVESCGCCAERAGAGAWPGGHCCSGRTEELFTDDELAALRLSGTTPRQLIPAHGSHRGCSFRSVRGCSLASSYRPCLCVTYACRDLERELRQRSDGPQITALREELRRTFERFVQARRERRDTESFRELEATLLAKPTLGQD